MMMNNGDIFKQLILEYMINRFDSLKYDYDVVKHRIDFRDINSNDYYDLLVCEVRLQAVAHEFRFIRNLLDIYF